MSAQIISLRSIAIAGPLLLCAVGIGVPTSPAGAAECLGAPTSGPPEGSHWYYRTDRAKGRKCWFLRSLNPPAQDTAAQEDTPATAPATNDDAVEEPATASAGVQFEAGAAISSPPLPVPRPQSASTDSATTQEPVRQPTEQPTEKESAAAPIPEPLTPQPSASSQTIAQEPATRPSAAVVWPDPPTVATVKVGKPDRVSDDASPHAVPPTAVVRPARNPEGIAQISARTTESAKTTNASTGTLAEILLIVMLALTAAGLLYRLVAKITAARDRRIVMAHSGLDWVRDDRQEHQFRPRGFINGREKFVDDLRLSLVPTADDYGARRPIAPRSNGLREGRASQIADEFSGRENRWAQLLRDLDQIMQSRKEA